MTFPTPEHIEAARLAADRVKARTGFYCWPSVTLAQALIESAGWTKLAGRNNGFGVKANPAQIAAGLYTEAATREFVHGREVRAAAKFADYTSLAAAYEAHALLFVRVNLYAAALKAANPRQFVVEMARYYATAPNYASVVIGAMDRLDLYRYDDPAQAVAQPLRPAARDAGRAQAPAAGGAAVVVGGAVAAAQGGPAPMMAGLVIAAAAFGLAFWRLRQAQAGIAGIPPLAPSKGASP